MTVVIESDTRLLVCVRSDWFFLVLVTFCSLETKTNKKCVLCQRNRTMPL